MHGLTGGGWKRSAGQGRSESCPGETPGRGAETYRRSTPPRQPPTLLLPGRSFISPVDFNAQLHNWLAITNARRQAQGYSPDERIDADRQAMLPVDVYRCGQDLGPSSASTLITIPSILL